MSFFKRLFCTHDIRFVQEIHGDLRNLVNGRYEYRCLKCNKVIFTDYIISEKNNQ